MFHNLNVNEYRSLYLLFFQGAVYFVALLGADTISISMNLFYLLIVLFLCLFAGGSYFAYREKNWTLFFMHLLVFLAPVILMAI